MHTNFSEHIVHVSIREFKFAKADKALLLSILLSSLGLAFMAALFIPIAPITAVVIGVINGTTLFKLVENNKKTHRSAPNPLMVILCAILMAPLVYMGGYAFLWFVSQDVQSIPLQLMITNRDVFGLQIWMDNWLWPQLLLELSITIFISSLIGLWRLNRHVVVKVVHDYYPGSGL